MWKRRSGDIVLTLGAAALIALFWKLRLTDPAKQIEYPSGDLFGQIYPMWLRAADWMRHGKIPLWNPYQMCGYPFLASVIYGIFYPLNVSRLFVPIDIALEITLVLHLFAAWLFTYLYARSGLRLTPTGSAAAASAFALCGSVMFDAAWFTPAVGAAVWLPLAFLAIERIIDKRSARWSVLLAIAVAMPILAGWLQTWFHSMQAVVLYSAIRFLPLVRRSRRRHAGSIALLIAAGVVLGIALAAVQLLPSIELQHLGWRRPGGLSLDQQLLMGAGSPQYLWSQATEAHPGFPRHGYMGIVTVLLVPVTLILLLERHERAIGLWMVVVWSAGVALTVYSPIFAIYRWLPGGTWFRFPSRIVLIYSFAAAALLGLAVDGLASDMQRYRRAIIVMMCSVMGLVYLYTASPTVRGKVYVVVCIALVCATAARRWRSTVTVMLVVLVTADLFFATWDTSARPYGHTAAYDTERSILNYVKVRQEYDRTYTAYQSPFSPDMLVKQGTLRGIYMISDYEVLSTERYARYCAALSSATKNEPFVGVCSIDPSRRSLTLLDRLSTRFIISATGLTDLNSHLKDAGWRVVYPPVDTHYLVYENPNPSPRAYVAYRPAVVDDGDAALNFVESAARPTAVVLERSDGLLPASGADDGSGDVTPARIARYEPTSVEVDARAAEPGYLVLTDTFYPGWRAYVDGHNVPILRANYLFRAVPIPAGDHRVMFRFVPITFWAGLAISMAAAVCLGAIAVRGGSGSR